MRPVHCSDCIEFYLSNVLAKFLLVDRALCTKNQSHEINFRASELGPQILKDF